MTGEAEKWERRIQLAAHPVALRMLELAAKRGPVVRLPRIGVLLSDPVIAREVLTDSISFTKNGPGSPADLWTPVVGPTVLLNMEGPAHAELRRKLGPLFTARAVSTLAERVGSNILDSLPPRLTGWEAVDLVTTARQLAASTICELVGLRAAGMTRTRLESVLDAASRVTSMVRLGRPSLTDRQIRTARTALASLTEPAARAWRDGTSDTVPGRMRQLGLSEAEAVGAVAAFVLVGTETMISFLPRIVALLQDSGWWQKLLADPTAMPGIVAEALRFTVPSPVMLRSVAKPAAIGGIRVRVGDRVIIATALAARTSPVFDPSTADAATLRQIWFGAGSHFCLGMPLAMAQIDLFLRALLRVERAGTEIVVRDRAVARRVLIPGYRRLVVGRV